MPSVASFIYGHTHKPFEKDGNVYKGSGSTSIYNSGGWVVDTPAAARVHGGAVILLDENHDVVSLRMYNEAENPEEYSVKVKAVAHPGGPPNRLLDRVRALINAQRDPWKAFSQTVAQERLLGVKNLKMKIGLPD